MPLVLGMVVIIVTSSVIDAVFTHVVLGGYGNSGSYLMWGVTIVLAAALVFPRAATIAVLALVLGTAVVLGFLEEGLASGRVPPDPALTTLLSVIVLVGNVGLLAFILISVLNRLSAERARAEGLLHDILPRAIARRLKAAESPIADRIEDVTVLFADVVDSTTIAEALSAADLVGHLDSLFSHFDDLAREHGCEKITTIGDAYHAVAGAPAALPDHTAAAADLALAMRDSLDRFPVAGRGPLQMRFGLHTGAVVAGVIGKDKFGYDLWGDTVNTASRMESHGAPGMIHVTAAVRAELGGRYTFDPRGTIAVKGKGEMETYFLLGREGGS